MKLHIATSRSIGLQCIAHTKDFLSANQHDYVHLIDDPEEADVFISVMYDSLVSEQYIEREGRRCYNFHPGILPQYRGSGAFSWALINNDKTCGVTLHKLEVDIDSGPIIAIKEYAIEPWDTAKTLFDKGMLAIYDLFKRFLPSIIAGDHILVPQQTDKVRIYYRKDLIKEKDVTRYVRAFTYEGKESAYYLNRAGDKVYLRWQ